MKINENGPGLLEAALRATICDSLRVEARWWELRPKRRTSTPLSSLKPAMGACLRRLAGGRVCLKGLLRMAPWPPAGGKGNSARRSLRSSASRDGCVSCSSRFSRANVSSIPAHAFFSINAVQN